MNKAPIAAAMLVAICTASVLFAYAEPAPRSEPLEDDGIHYCRTLLEQEEQLVYDAQEMSSGHPSGAVTMR